MMITQFMLPELGENISDGDVITVLVKSGDTVTRDQTVLEMETGKATVEVPISMAGVVKDVLVKEGDKAQIGQVILTIDKNDAAPTDLPPPSKHEPEIKPEAKKPVPAITPAPPPMAQPPPGAVPDALPRHAANKVPVAAAPSVRKFARELGVDIGQVKGNGPGGRISVDDVKRYTKGMLQSGSGIHPATTRRAQPLPDFTKWGDVERIAMSNNRKSIAEHMSRSWATIPHVTQHDKADITRLEQLRKVWASKAEKMGGKLTPTAMLMKITATALKAFPQFNASIDIGNSELISKKYIHIGVAVDTPKGLVVPIIRDVDKMNILRIAVELTDIAARARVGKIGLDEMQGGTFTITNLGGIGGSYFTPIINYPEVAILGIGRAGIEPVYQEHEFVPRLFMPLSLSYDHRVIDGANAARFVRWIAEAIEEPLLLALEG